MEKSEIPLTKRVANYARARQSPYVDTAVCPLVSLDDLARPETNGKQDAVRAMQIMKTLAAVLLTLGILAGCESTPTQPAAPSAGAATPGGLEGSTWRLVQIVYGDGTIRAAIDRSRYTIRFGTAGVLNVRFDCNRGRGSWKSTGPGNLEFGDLALTRAQCPTGSLYDDLARQWPNVRSYIFKDGRLFLALMADGGTLEFEPSP